MRSITYMGVGAYGNALAIVWHRYMDVCADGNELVTVWIAL